ncbi:helix-turn-helix domain-containing protein [Streptomyces sp. NPDC098077]|uniref:helix-turn-helix domain-containing protein n=1 Tax=Streptomyces sp. NPDC098077 TaxID=3366093 RepID=UPI0037FD78BF
MALSSNEWAAEIAKRVGRQVAFYRSRIDEGRTKPGITAQALADRCTELGLPIDRTVVAKLEKGVRQTITVGELMVFARALNVPPVALLFDLREATTEVLPGVEANTWDALKWLTGEVTGLPGAEGTADGEYGVELLRHLDRLIAGWREQKRTTMALVRDRVSQPAAGGDSAFFDQLMRTVADQEAAIADLRREIRSEGLVPPPLPPDLEHLEVADTPAGRELNKYAPRTDGEK